jgi:Rubredoxin-like zinc ribbon domain (DUF35_N)
VLELARRGLRERIVKLREAPDRPFAIGEFELVVEPLPGASPSAEAPPPEAITPAGPLVQIRTRRNAGHDGGHPQAPGRVPPKLDLCRACNRYVYPHEVSCPHCGADIAAARDAHEETVQRRRALIEQLERALALASAAP